MLLIFRVCFYVGVALTVVALVFGSLFDFINFDALDFDLDGAEGGLPFNPLICVIFATVFGGSGIIMIKSLKVILPLIVLFAAVLAVSASFLIQHFIFRPLKKAQNTSAPDMEELIGLPAKVNERIVEGGFGEITYIIHGNSFSAPAKTVDGSELKKGCEVSICWIKEHVFYVTPLSGNYKQYEEIEIKNR